MADTAGNSIETSPVESIEDANNALQQLQQNSSPAVNAVVTTTSLDSNGDDDIMLQEQQQANESDNNNNNDNIVGDSLVDVNPDNNNNDSMLIMASNNDSIEGGLDMESDSPTRMQQQQQQDGGDAPPVELLADDAAQSRYQHKMVEEQVNQMEKTALPLALAFQKYAMRIGNLRDGGDGLTQRLIQLAELCSYNTSVRSGMANCTRWLACLLDHTNVRAYRIQNNVAVPLINKFSEQFKLMQQELKTTRKALEKEEQLFKRLTRSRGLQRGSLEYQKIYSSYQNARRDRGEASARLELSLNILRTNRMSDVRQAMRNFCHTELHYHCKAIETLTEAYQQVKSMDVEKDQHEFRRALNIAGMMNKSTEHHHHQHRRQHQQQQSSSPVRTRSGMRARLRQARSRYMMRNNNNNGVLRSQQKQHQTTGRYVDKPDDMQYDMQFGTAPPPALITIDGGGRPPPQNITARTVARELHQVDTLIDQNQMRLQNLQHFEPTARSRPHQRLNNTMNKQQNRYYTDTTINHNQHNAPLSRPPAPTYYAGASQSAQPPARATSAPPPRRTGGIDNNNNNLIATNRGQQKPYEDDAMFDYLNQRLQVEQKRYDREWEARNRFENEQFKSMRQLASNAADSTQNGNNNNNYATESAMIQQSLNDAVQARREVIKKNRQQTAITTTTNRRTPTTRETKTSFHTTDYDHGPVTIFPAAPAPRNEIDYNRTHDTTSFHSHDIRDPRAVAVPRTAVVVAAGGGAHQPMQQQNYDRQRRASGSSEQRGPIIYRNPDPPAHLNDSGGGGGGPNRNSNNNARPMSADNNNQTTTRVVQQQEASYYYER